MGKGKNKDERNRDTLIPREEWDFEKCPTGKERHCFYYEYARESPWIIDDYHLAKRCQHKVKFGWQCGFDEFGNWHFWQFGNGERGDDWHIVIQVPPGFPQSPYLLTSHHIVEPEVKGVVAEPAFCEAEEWKKQGFSDQGTWTRIRLKWDVPDKLLVNEFQKWLKRNRPRRARERRGSSESRRHRADLKALGAYRLMVKGKMTAEAAKAYTQRFIPHGLYAEIPDWYEAKGRATFVLEEYFRYRQDSVAKLILADEPCATCPARKEAR